MHITFAFLTSRVDPKIEWFLDGLNKQLGSDYTNVKIVVVDFYADQPGRKDTLDKAAHWPLVVVPPKPTVWQGPSRLTQDDWWAAANGRNTALCHAPDGWIVYVDDLTVLTPHWLQSIRLAIHGGYVVIGAYKKVNNLIVENGEAKSYTPYSEDCRLKQVSQDLTPCQGGWMFGSSSGSVADYLKVGGWPEYSDGLKFEDCLMGIGMVNAGIRLVYDRRMLHIESEELHHGGKVFVAKDKGISPKDKSHAALDIANNSKFFANTHAHPGGIAALRREILAGGSFPAVTEPSLDWYDKQPLSEMS